MNACSIHDFVHRQVVKMQLRAVYIARNWFAGHGSCQHNDIIGALMALQNIAEAMTRIPACTPQLAGQLESTRGAVALLLKRLSTPQGTCHMSLPTKRNLRHIQATSPYPSPFILASRSFHYVEAAAAALTGARFDSFGKVADALKSHANTHFKSNASALSAHLTVLSDVRNRVFHSLREIMASMYVTCDPEQL